MRGRSASGMFPCPFCRSSAVLLIGGSRVYLYYQCGDCAEIWTALDVPLDYAPYRMRARPSSTVH